MPGVGNVEVLSSDTREIEVIVDPAKLRAANLTIDDVAEALKNANQLTPVGRYTDNGLQHLVLSSGLWDSVADIGGTPIVVKDARDAARGGHRDGRRRARPIARRLSSARAATRR